MSITLPNPEKYLDSKTKANLDAIKKHRLGKKYDYVVLITAAKTGVGEGKSNLFHLLCAYVGGDRFTIKRVMFDGMDYRMEESALQPLDAWGFDEPDAFASTESMTRDARKLKLKFSKIRQKRHFIVICAPSIFDVASWVRGTGHSRVNCIIRIVRRGVFYAYGDKTGAKDKIKIDTKKRIIKWPECDFIGFFKKIPEKSEWWEAYTKKKNNFLKHADENPKAVKMMKIQRMKLENTLTLRHISEIQKVHVSTVKNWIKAGHFGKPYGRNSGVFMGVDNKTRIKVGVYKKGMRRVERAKQLAATRRGKRGKDKKKRKKGSRGHRKKKVVKRGRKKKR